MPTLPTSRIGKVFLVGAGPGDPGLITARGIECLAAADLVLFDYLVNPRLLEHLSANAESICLGRHGEGRMLSQTEVNRRMIEAAQVGKMVVRLKSGDPMIFGRAAEELAALAEGGIAVEIVPGVTAAVAVAAYTGVSITRRDLASAVAFVTAKESSAQGESRLDYTALARFPGTLVFYMVVTTAKDWTAELMAAGMSSDTPAVIVRRCTWPDQRTISCSLSQVAATIAESRIRPPVVVVIGAAAGEVRETTWFEQRPLFRKRILIARPEQQAAGLRSMLEAEGAEVLVQPAIRIGPPADWGPVDAAIERLATFDWLVFSSSNGVRFFLDRLLAGKADLRRLAGVKLAAIGPGTAATLAEYQLKVDLQPLEYRAEELAKSLAAEASGRRYLLLRASRGREVLARELGRAGAHVEQVVAYSSTDVTDANPRITALLAAGEIDFVVVSSSAIAQSLQNLFADNLQRTRLVSISPITTDALRELGYPPALEAAEYTMDGIVAAILADVDDAPDG